MKYPYCLPILKSDKQEILAIIHSQKDAYRYFEVWLDYIDDLDTTFIQELVQEWGDRLVVVFLRQELATIQMTLGQRYELLNILNKSSVLVDLDVLTQRAEFEYIEQRGIRLQAIISYHNYRHTPKNSELQNILQQIRKENPTILKIATKCQNEKDSLRLLNILLSLQQTGQKYIVLGMGNHGAITRIFGALWGNQLVFAPETADEQSAPGQLTRKQLDNVLHIIGE